MGCAILGLVVAGVGLAVESDGDLLGLLGGGPLTPAEALPPSDLGLENACKVVVKAFNTWPNGSDLPSLLLNISNT